jgi:hypothetical protein
VLEEVLERRQLGQTRKAGVHVRRGVIGDDAVLDTVDRPRERL